MPAERRVRWGWHQLADRTARRLVDAAGIRPGDLVLDLGAGTGALTAPLVANPPFTCTAAILRRLLHPGSRLLTADLLVPRHVAIRWASGRAPAAHRWLAVFEPRFVTDLPRSAFRPAPPGATAVLRIERRA